MHILPTKQKKKRKNKSFKKFILKIQKITKKTPKQDLEQKLTIKIYKIQMIKLKIGSLKRKTKLITLGTNRDESRIKREGTNNQNKE